MMRMNPMQLMNAFRNAKNPQALLQQVMQNNPQLQQVMTQLHPSYGVLNKNKNKILNRCCD